MSEAANNTICVVVCVNMTCGLRGKCCGLSGSPEIADALEKGV
ncbi:MAG: hypothetical protein VXZ99_10545 [Pseudomonadota bacterium]|nr:hypothetical protein [Pseudomonadota bacterium]